LLKNLIRQYQRHGAILATELWLMLNRYYKDSQIGLTNLSHAIDVFFSFFFLSSIYYMEHVGKPWQHYVKGSYIPPAHVISVPPRPNCSQ